MPSPPKTGRGLWAQAADRVIDGVLHAYGHEDDPRVLQRYFRKAYPFGERKNWPYKVWLARVRHALAVRAGEIEPKREDEGYPEGCRQLTLFGENV